MTKTYGACKMTKETLDRVNKHIRETLDSYYRNPNADDFFRLDDILGLCRSQDLTVEEVPALIEMQNVILLG